MDLVVQGLADALRLIVTRDPQLLAVAGLSLAVSGAAAALAALIGVPVGAALHMGKLPGRRAVTLAVNTGMGLPPVVVGLLLTLLLWRTGPLGALRLLYTPSAMVIAQFIVATPLVAGFTRAALELLDRDLVLAMRADGAGDARAAYELVHASAAQVLVAIAAGFGRAIAEVGASLMVGGNIVGQTRILTTAIALETGRGDFALALALGLLLLLLALLVNVGLNVAAQEQTTGRPPRPAVARR